MARPTRSSTPKRTPLDPVAEEVLRGIRDLRFAAGVRCPRCAHERCARWGSFSGRQRYRCRGCRRTFSDLTGTALSYTKRLPCWRDYLLGMREGESLRRAAAAVGIHVSTAFRWRHRVLRSTRHGEVALRFWVEGQELIFAASAKGTRLPPGTARRRGARFRREWWTTRHERVLVLRDRHAIGRSIAVDLRPPADAMRTALLAAIAPGSTLLLVRRGGWRSYLNLTRACGVNFECASDASGRAPDGPRHVRNILPYSRRLIRWLRRFRGVASHYRDNYLAWHRIADPDSAAGWLHGCFGHVAPPPTRPP